MDLEEFKDFDQNEEKLYGTELYNELPSDERKLKYEENVIILNSYYINKNSLGEMILYLTPHI